METLGYRALHNGFNDERIMDILARNNAQGRPLLAGLEGYDFFSDFNGSAYLPQLYKQYPGSTYILTIRDMDSWLDSRAYHVRRNQKDPRYTHGVIHVEPDVWRREREDRLQKINDFFRGREDELLVIDICGGQGWETLCPFLGKPIPSVPFPYLHTREEMDKDLLTPG